MSRSAVFGRRLHWTHHAPVCWTTFDFDDVHSGPIFEVNAGGTWTLRIMIVYLNFCGILPVIK